MTTTNDVYNVMDIEQIGLLSVVQGLTEFLPISSSAHLILTSLWFGQPLQDLAFDVAVHIGTLSAVMWYFRHELKNMLTTIPALIRQPRLATPEAHLTRAILFAMVPLLIFGWPLKQVLDWLRTDPRLLTMVIASTTIGFGILLWIADRWGQQVRDEWSLNWKTALIIGSLQVIAIIPGTSRSGITMTGGLWLGLTRQAASRFSFLLSIPTILLAALLAVRDVMQAPTALDWYAFFLGAVLSGLVAYLTIHFFLRWIERLSMTPFVFYRLLLGALLITVVMMN
jgi:undecaprenyl-diphosphatase